MIYTHVLNKGGKVVLSPLNGMHITPADLTMATRQEETDEPE